MEELLALCSTSQKQELLDSLEENNKQIESEIYGKENELKKTAQAARVLLSRVWRMLSIEDRKALAVFFKEINDELVASQNLTNLIKYTE